MKQAQPDLVPVRPSGSAWKLAAWLLVCLVAGCTPEHIPSFEPPTYYHPANVAVESPFLPATVRRVALLPLTAVENTQLQQGVDSLAPVVDAELKKTARFEVITVTPAQMREWTGKPAWRADETLPIDFFRRLQRETGSDAVMFSEITRYQPYQPLAIGWKLCLAAQGAGEQAEPHKLWSVDDVLDGGDGKISRAARTYYSQHLQNSQGAGDASTILRSPAMFAQFTLNALFATLPARSAQ
jgi:hypothetical protein